jgi:putative aldouronate transport system substrate-binding protein
LFAASLACASGGEEGSTTAGPVTLVQYNRIAGNVSDSPEVYAKMNEILSDRIGVQMDYVDVPGSEYNQKISVVINSGEAYDICFTSNWSNNYLQNVAKGAFADLTDLLPVKAPEYYSNLLKYWDATKVNGRIYAAINEQIFARSRMTNIPFDIVEKAGIDLEDFSRRGLAGENLLDLDYEMRKMIKPVIDDTYVMTSAGSSLVFQGLYWDDPTGVVGSVAKGDPNYKVFNQYDTPEYRELLQYNRKLIDEGLIMNVDKIRTSEGVRIARAEGKYVDVIANGGTFKPGGQEQLAKRWQYMNLQVQMQPAFLTTGGIIATMLGVSSTSKQVDKACEYFNEINTDQELYMLFHYGIEGKHYTVNDDGFMVVAEGSNYLRGVPWAMGNQFLQIPV